MQIIYKWKTKISFCAEENFSLLLGTEIYSFIQLNTLLCI